jgi:hypothetical protein
MTKKIRVSQIRSRLMKKKECPGKFLGPKHSLEDDDR